MQAAAIRQLLQQPERGPLADCRRGQALAGVTAAGSGWHHQGGHGHGGVGLGLSHHSGVGGATGAA